MTPFWHPLSGVFLTDPPIPASRSVLAMFLAAGPLEVVYAGDRMFPALRPGARVRLERLGERGADPGEVVAATDGSVVDLFRVHAADAGRLELGGDADPSEPRTFDRSALIGRASLAPASPSRAVRLARRLRLDLREAWSSGPDADGAATVREKYESQATHYARVDGPGLEPRLAVRLRAALPEGGRVLVVGSGAGRETIALAKAGYRARGIDFAPAMVAAARAAAAQAGVDTPFEAADVRVHDEPPASLDGVLFTYDVYSFIPGSSARVEALRRMGAWLRSGGRVYLSARRVQGLWARGVLAVQRLRGAREPGDSHTRWFDRDGTIRRSYVHVFDDRALRREIAEAGGRCLAWEGGHGEIAFGEGR